MERKRRSEIPAGSDYNKIRKGSWNRVVGDKVQMQRAFLRGLNELLGEGASEGLMMWVDGEGHGKSSGRASQLVIII